MNFLHYSLSLLIRKLILASRSISMASTSKTCYLRSTESSHLNVTLPDNHPVYIGRSPDTQVTDTCVSRRQLKATADTKEKFIEVVSEGRAVSGCNGFALKKDVAYKLKHGDVLELRLGLHRYEVVFDPPPDNDEDEVPKKKMKFDVSGTDVRRWEDFDRSSLLVFSSEGVTPSAHIAGFDMDGTLIRTKSGAVFGRNSDDWMLNFDNVAAKLKEMHGNGFKIVIFTNQAGIGNYSSRVKEFKEKLEKVVDKLKVPIQAFVATKRDLYRKPLIGMWETLRDVKNGKVTLDLGKSFFVGDAAGREKNWAPKKRKDHSLADRLFALNIGIKFYTPEEFFLGARSVSYRMPEFDPRSLTPSKFTFTPNTQQEAILMVGAPGSGKSTFCKNYLLPKGYKYVNRDKLGSWQKCVKALEDALHSKNNVVVDNTNPTKETRKKYLDVVKKNNVACRCFIMATTLKHAKHNSRFRELTDTSHVVVSDIVINSYNKQFEQPDASEGFSEIVEVPFLPVFEDKKLEKLYSMFLLED